LLSHTRRSVYFGSSGGTASRSFRSTVSRSASPLPWAIQVPSQARKIGSSAVTSPLAGIRTLSDLPSRECMYGSRLETTNSRLLLSLLRTCTASRSAVHVDSPASRRRASFSADSRAAARLCTRVVTSFLKGMNKSPSGNAGGEETLPAREALIHCSVLAAGPSIVQRIISSA